MCYIFHFSICCTFFNIWSLLLAVFTSNTHNYTHAHTQHKHIHTHTTHQHTHQHTHTHSYHFSLVFSFGGVCVCLGRSSSECYRSCIPIPVVTSNVPAASQPHGPWLTGLAPITGPNEPHFASNPKAFNEPTVLSPIKGKIKQPQWHE